MLKNISQIFKSIFKIICILLLIGILLFLIKPSIFPLDVVVSIVSLIVLIKKELPIFLLGLPIFFTVFYLIGKKDFENTHHSKKLIFIIGYLSTLILTAFSYEMIITPIGLFVLIIDVIFWKIQMSIIKRVFLKQKNTYLYWLWNITSPEWTLWINGYKNEGSGSHNYWGYTLYIIGSICLTIFVLKKSSFRLECEKLKSEKNFI